MFTYRKLKLKSKNKSVEIFSIINYISRRKTSIDIHVSYDLLIKHIAQLCELIISGVEMYENMIIYCLISTAMGIGRDQGCKSQAWQIIKFKFSLINLLKILIEINLSMTGPAVEAQDFSWAGPGRWDPRFLRPGPGRYGSRFQLGRAEDLQPWFRCDLIRQKTISNDFKLTQIMNLCFFFCFPKYKTQCRPLTSPGHSVMTITKKRRMRKKRFSRGAEEMKF